MARQRREPAQPDPNQPQSILGRILGRIGGVFRPQRQPRSRCWQWMYGCVWEDEAGNHIFYKAHAVVTSSPDNYQEASAKARREVLAGLSQSERQLTAMHPGATFRCRRVGPVIEVRGPC